MNLLSLLTFDFIKKIDFGSNQYQSNSSPKIYANKIIDFFWILLKAQLLWVVQIFLSIPGSLLFLFLLLGILFGTVYTVKNFTFLKVPKNAIFMKPSWAPITPHPFQIRIVGLLTNAVYWLPFFNPRCESLSIAVVGCPRKVYWALNIFQNPVLTKSENFAFRYDGFDWKDECLTWSENLWIRDEVFVLLFEFGILRKVSLSHVPLDLNHGAFEVDFVFEPLALLEVVDTADTDQFGDVMVFGSKMVQFNEFSDFVDDSWVLDFLVGPGLLK